MYYDYRLEGQKQIICANLEGDVKGFTITANKQEYVTKDDTEQRE